MKADPLAQLVGFAVHECCSYTNTYKLTTQMWKYMDRICHKKKKRKRNKHRYLPLTSGGSHFFVFGTVVFAIIIIIIWVDRVKLCHIQALVNAPRDGLDVSNQLILNVLQVVAVL